MQKLKKEIELRYRIMRYKKLMRRYILNRFEKNNVEIIYKAIEDLKQGNDFWDCKQAACEKKVRIGKSLAEHKAELNKFLESVKKNLNKGK